MKETKDYNKLLYEKMSSEYNEFQKRLDEMIPQEVIGHAYEIIIKEDILTCFEFGEYSQSEAKALYRLKNPLEDLYQKWLGTDYNYMDQLRDVIDERAESAVKEMREKQCESR